MLTKLFFPDVPGVRVERLWREGRMIHMKVATTRQRARCPLCHRRSRRIHSQYQRTITAIPCCGDGVTIHLHVRRFVCRVRSCARKIFTERVPALVAPSARRSVRLRERLQRDGFDLGGERGARHATAEGMPVSARTLLRLVRAAPLPAAGPVKVLGVDDFAKRKGHNDGTILVNLETHEVIDLLPDRTAETLAAWLTAHPEVEIISRDRGGAYAEGARQGAPQAVQVADRFHLLANLTEAVQRVLNRHHSALRQAAQDVLRQEQDRIAAESGAASGASVPPVPWDLPSPLAPTTPDRETRRARRHARYEEVQELRRQGLSISAIACHLQLTRPTVRKLVQADACPEPAARPGLLTPYEPYLWLRWTQGCQNAAALWREIQARGYRGSYVHLRHALRRWRTRPARRGRAAGVPAAPPLVPSPTLRAFSPRQATWLLLRQPDELEADERAFVVHLVRACPEVQRVQEVAQEFGRLVRTRDSGGFDPWLAVVDHSGCPEMCGFADGLRRDRAAVEAALEMEWNNGPVEGLVNKLKVAKRAMYGRAKLDLLRQRVLHAA